VTLVYRAVWDDFSCDPVGVLDDEFTSWCVSKGVAPVDIPRRGHEDLSDHLRIEVRRADTEAGRALQCRLREVDNRGRIWTTTATALADREVSTFWVDLDRNDPDGRSGDMAAPRLVRGLVENGGEPTAFGLRLRTHARRIREPNVHELLDVLLDQERRVPVVVFSPDLEAGPQATLQRANAAAETLIGIAVTFAFDPTAQKVLDQVLPEGFRVYAGAVRMYLPGLQLDDPDDALRHRFLPRRQISVHPRRAASLLATRLARQQLHQPIPQVWDRFRTLLLLPTEGEIGDRVATLGATRPAGRDSAEVDELQQRIGELERHFAKVVLTYEAQERELRLQVESLESTVAELEKDSWADADEMEALRRERDSLQRTIRVLHYPPTASEPVDDPHLFEPPPDIEDAIRLAQTHLSCVVIPDTAMHAIDELSNWPKYQVWASALWQGLLALHEYASRKAKGDRPPGFRSWCEETSAWPVSKLAMVESDSVQNNRRLRDQRYFPVHPEVDRRGRIHMFAHLKIQEGGGSHIPRVYFYDDTDGPTRKMHVGFIGPHRFVQNTKA
jgi:hypothetical protein